MWEKVGIVIMFGEIVGRVTMIVDTSAMCACITEVAWFQDEGIGAPSPTVGLRTPTPPSRNRPKGGEGKGQGTSQMKKICLLVSRLTDFLGFPIAGITDSRQRAQPLTDCHIVAKTMRC